jgi:hypothetical protein
MTTPMEAPGGDFQFRRVVGCFQVDAVIGGGGLVRGSRQYMCSTFGLK